MARNYDEFHEDNKGTLVDEFQTANPEYWAKLQSNPEGVRHVREILQFTEETVTQWKDEQSETFRMRVAEEAVKVFEERTNQKLTPQSPGGVINLSSESLLEEARKRVISSDRREQEAIEQQGLVAVNIAANISEKKMEELKMSEEEQTHFKADLHKAVDTAQKARTQSRRLFFQERENLIDEAKAAGSQQPEKDVGQAQAKIMADIDRQEHKDIHTVFETYGWERSKRAVEFHEDDSVQQADSPAKNKLVKHVQSFVQDKVSREQEQSGETHDHATSQLEEPSHGHNE